MSYQNKQIKMKLLLVGSFLAAILATVFVEDYTTRISHHGLIIEVFDSAKQTHLDHGDEVMVLYNGHWIPNSTYEAFQEQRAIAEKASSVTPKGNRYMSFGEWNEYDD